MNKLIQELQRLYFPPGHRWSGPSSPGHAACEGASAESMAGGLSDDAGAALDLPSVDSTLRAMVIAFEKAGDWERVAELFRGLQEDLELPAPAISVSGQDGYLLWLSLAEPASAMSAEVFLDALRGKYLGDIPRSRLRFYPDSGAAEPLPLAAVPARHPVTGKWSAFIDPSMGAMFIDESGLEMAPNMDRQADILCRLKSIEAGDLARALRILRTTGESPTRPTGGQGEGAGAPPAPGAAPIGSRLDVGSNYSDPKSFLLAVMNDPSATASQRIQAARALLPYFNTDQAEEKSVRTQ